MHKQELAGPDIFSVHGFLSPDECRHYIAFSEAAGYGDAPINAGFGAQVVRKDVRNNDRVMVDDVAAAAQLWERVQPFIPDPLDVGFCRWWTVGLNERLRFYRYDVGQRFHWHYDGSFERGPMERSNLTFMVYLNDDFEGGATEFNLGTHDTARLDDPILRVVPETGKLLVFRHPILHQGAAVTRGRKYVLRSDVMYRYAGSA